MYAGNVMEYADVNTLFSAPRHPYTQGLMASVPVIGKKTQAGKLQTIPGVVPSLFNLPRGCKFNDRCPDAFDDCFEIAPEMYEPEKNHRVRCLKYA